MRAASLLMAIVFAVLGSAALAQTDTSKVHWRICAVPGAAPASQPNALPEIDTGPAWTKLPRMRLYKNSESVPCSTAAERLTALLPA